MLFFPCLFAVSLSAGSPLKDLTRQAGPDAVVAVPAVKTPTKYDQWEDLYERTKKPASMDDFGEGDSQFGRACFLFSPGSNEPQPLRILKKEHVDYLQGNYFSHPRYWTLQVLRKGGAAVEMEGNRSKDVLYVSSLFEHYYLRKSGNVIVFQLEDERERRERYGYCHTNKLVAPDESREPNP